MVAYAGGFCPYASAVHELKHPKKQIFIAALFSGQELHSNSWLAV
jgi:hypothetical protein